MPAAPTVLVIGATGLLGRPVTRVLVNEGLRVRTLVRDPARAAASLPEGCAVVRGDVRDRASIAAALSGVDAVYLSLSNAMTAERPAWDPDADGSLTVLDAAREAGVPHLLRLSALGVGDASVTWWVARAKRAVDHAMLESGVPCTIFRPTWFMESIPLSTVGPCLLRLPAPATPLYWIAADDYGRQVAAAIRRGPAPRADATGVFDVQGPEPISMRDAFRRFRRVWRSRLVTVPFPGAGLAVARRLVPQASYLAELLEMTFASVVAAPARSRAHDLHVPAITLEAFARDLLERGVWPTKSMRPG